TGPASTRARPAPTRRSTPAPTRASSSSPTRRSACPTRRRLRTRPPPSTPAARTSSGLARRRLAGGELHFDDLELAHALRGLRAHGVADLAADHRARDRRGDRDEAGLDVGLVLADDAVGLAFAAVGVLDGHRRAEDDLLARQARRVDDVGEGD